MSIQGILLDIEGTTSSISFVHDQMFPFARKTLPEFLGQNWGQPQLDETLDLLAVDLGQPDAQTWFADLDEAERCQERVVTEVNRLMDADKKVTGLKKLQGMVWKQGFDNGQLVAHVWPDVPAALQAWQRQGLALRIYSSGSVGAQKMFFGHSEFGDLLPFFSGHYDTQIGGKKEKASYQAIARDWGLPCSSILFISDVVEELQAAAEAGFQVCLSLRPGNAPVPHGHGFAESSNFKQLESLTKSH